MLKYKCEECNKSIEIDEISYDLYPEKYPYLNNYLCEECHLNSKRHVYMIKTITHTKDNAFEEYDTCVYGSYRDACLELIKEGFEVSYNYENEHCDYLDFEYEIDDEITYAYVNELEVK